MIPAMTHTDAIPALSMTALWERSQLSRTGDETALIVRITAGQPDAPDEAGRAPLDIAFALDRSGSMGGPGKIELVKQAVSAATHHLTDDDRVALIIFDHEVEVLHELTPATASGRRRLERVLAGVHARGSTNLSGGWLTSCQQLAAGARLNGTVRLQRSLLLTDGLANEGITDPHELMHHATELRQRGIDTTTIGVRHHFDEMLLSGMAEAGGGAFQYISDTAMLRSFFEREIGSLMDIVAIRPVLSITFPEGVRGQLVNAFPVERSGKTVRVDLRDLAAGESVDLVFDVTVRMGASGDDVSPMAELQWLSPRSGQRVAIHEELTGLSLVEDDIALHAPRDEEASAIAALERAARSQHEAVRLDREGDYRASRQAFQRSADLLSAAPQTVAVREEMMVASNLAMAAERPLDEHTRKQRVFETHARSRGRGQSRHG
jgi:Ca-activated chloride channel family protein